MSQSEPKLEASSVSGSNIGGFKKFLKYFVVFFVIFGITAIVATKLLSEKSDSKTAADVAEDKNFIFKKRAELLKAKSQFTTGYKFLLDEVKPEEVDPTTSVTIPTTAEKSAAISTKIGSIEERIKKLEDKDKYITLYFATTDLEKSLSNSDAFKKKLEYVTLISVNFPEISGKLDILKQSSEPVLESRQTLRKQLQTLKEAYDEKYQKSLWDKVVFELNNLVTITDLKGETDASNYVEVIAKADYFLEGNNPEGIKLAIAEVAKLGKETEGWVRSANNLERVVEVIDYLREYSKSKLSQ